MGGAQVNLDQQFAIAGSLIFSWVTWDWYNPLKVDADWARREASLNGDNIWVAETVGDTVGLGTVIAVSLSGPVGFFIASVPGVITSSSLLANGTEDILRAVPFQP